MIENVTDKSYRGLFSTKEQKTVKNDRFLEFPFIC